MPLLHIGEGVEKTKAEAVEKAWELAGSQAEWIAAKYAAGDHRRKSGEKRKAKNPRFAGTPAAPEVQEFLYRDVYDPVTGHWNAAPHRVVKKTSRYVFVEQSPSSPGDMTGGWLERDRPVFRLDRQGLEQEGFVFLPLNTRIMDSEDPVFYSSEGKNKPGGLSLKCLEVLSIAWPCTTKDVRAAYRRLVKSSHPDGGGDHVKFLELQEAYEQALEGKLPGRSGQRE